MPKKSLKQKSTTNGNLEKEVNYKSAAQLLGDTGLTKYGTLDRAEYEAKLREFNTGDLNRYAIDHGVKPIHNREMTIKTLLAQFQKHANNFIVYDAKKYDVKVDKELEDLLKYGK